MNTSATGAWPVLLDIESAGDARRSTDEIAALADAAERLVADFPRAGVSVRTGRAVRGDALAVDVVEWSAPDFDPFEFDVGAAARPAPLHVVMRGVSRAPCAALERVSWSLLVRLQHRAPVLNVASERPEFGALLGHVAALHAAGTPLVRADHAHALDTWQWLLRLAPDADAAEQAAALLHDVERVASEPHARVEQHAADYAAYKRDHAARSAVLADSALRACGFDRRTAERAAELVRLHDAPGPDPGLVRLNDADALSFFSLNSSGFLRCYGPAHTARKIAHTLARLSPSAVPYLDRIRMREDVRDMTREVRTP